MPNDIIKLSFGNNLILGNCPKKLTLDKIANKNMQEQREIESFGLFDTSQPNYTTYYPEVTAEDLAPKDNEFIYPVYRSLSEVIVHKSHNPVDFSQNGVLQQSMKLLNGQAVNADHETAIGNSMGVIMESFWEESYKTKSGLIVPAGINSKLKIDGKSNPRIARGIMMDPPSIHSTSVTVEFAWEQSHPKMAREEFFSKIGTFDEKGELIMRVANKIKRYHEISLVSHGADPYAQKINDAGEINNPLFADISYNSAHPKDAPKSKFFFFDLKSEILENSENSIPKNSNNNKPTQNNLNMNKTLLAFAALMGLSFNEGIEDADATAQVQNKITEMVNAATLKETTITELREAATAQEAEVIRLKDIETKYNTEKALLANVTSLEAFKNKATEKLKAEVSKAYGILSAAKPDATITELIENGSFETLTALNIQYTTQLEEKFPTSCKKCGSKEVSRASAKLAETEDDANTATDAESVMEKLRAAKKKGANMLNLYPTETK